MRVIDLTDQRFGRLVVIERDFSVPKHAYWRCSCDCGGKVTVDGRRLRKGETKSCGCLRQDVGFAKLIDLTNERFGRLVVIERTKNRGVQPRWRCRCDCGGKHIAAGADLRDGRTKSCGCLRFDNMPNLIHGMSYTVEHNVWSAMKRRCYNLKDKDWKDYGGRGIKVCREWRDSFEAFFRDMGPRPGPGFSIERSDYNGDYTPANCVWETALRQANNSRHNHVVMYHGRRMSFADAVREAGPVVKYATALRRLNKCAWTVRDAVETPPLRMAA